MGMAMNSRMIRHLLSHPAEMVRFQATGRLPKPVRPASPLIDLLESLTPHERLAIRGLRVSRELGYDGSRVFANAEQALNWLKPAPEVFGVVHAESWRLKGFHRQLTLADLAAAAASVPESVARRCTPQGGEEGSLQCTVDTPDSARSPASTSTCRSRG